MPGYNFFSLLVKGLLRGLGWRIINLEIGGLECNLYLALTILFLSMVVSFKVLLERKKS